MGVGAYLSLIGRERGWGGRLLIFSAFRMGAYSRWTLIRGLVLIRINTVFIYSSVSFFQGFGAGNFKSLFEAIEQDQAQRGNLY